MKSLLRKLIWIPGLFLLGAANVHAAIITINFEGSMTYSEDYWGATVAGSLVTGSFSYDSTLVPTTNTGTINTFLSNSLGNSGKLMSMTFTVGVLSKTVTAADGLFNFTLNDNSGVSPNIQDRYLVTNNGTTTGQNFSFDLRDPLTTHGADAMPALTGMVPTLAPDLSLFGGTKTGRYWNSNGIVDDLRFNITSVSLASPIPEPEVYAMMGIGLALMGFVARRRRQGLGAA